MPGAPVTWPCLPLPYVKSLATLNYTPGMSCPHSVSHLGQLGPSRSVELRPIPNEMHRLKGGGSPPPKSHSQGTTEMGDS